MGRFWEKDPALPAEAGHRRSLDLAGPMQHRSTTESRRPASTSAPRRRSVDFRGTPAVIAVRCDLPDQQLSKCSSESLWGSGRRPPLSRRGSSASDTLA